MKIKSKKISHPKITLIEIEGDITSRNAIKLQEYLFFCLDDGNHFQLIDLKQVKKMDGLGIHILTYFITRGMHIRLFNVQTEIRSILRLSGKEEIIIIFNETDCDKSILLFETEDFWKRIHPIKSAKGRRHPRIQISLQAELSFPSNITGKIDATAMVLNICARGILVEQISAFDSKTGTNHEVQHLAGKELNFLKLSAHDDLGIIEGVGVFVWESKQRDNLSAGICFQNMSAKQRKTISDHVNKVSNESHKPINRNYFL